MDAEDEELPEEEELPDQDDEEVELPVEMLVLLLIDVLTLAADAEIENAPKDTISVRANKRETTLRIILFPFY